LQRCSIAVDVYVIEFDAPMQQEYEVGTGPDDRRPSSLPASEMPRKVAPRPLRTTGHSPIKRARVQQRRKQLTLTPDPQLRVDITHRRTYN
jgi:hypothetical protein